MNRRSFLANAAKAFIAAQTEGAAKVVGAAAKGAEKIVDTVSIYKKYGVTDLAVHFAVTTIFAEKDIRKPDFEKFKQDLQAGKLTKSDVQQFLVNAQNHYRVQANRHNLIIKKRAKGLKAIFGSEEFKRFYDDHVKSTDEVGLAPEESVPSSEEVVSEIKGLIDGPGDKFVKESERLTEEITRLVRKSGDKIKPMFADLAAARKAIEYPLREPISLEDRSSTSRLVKLYDLREALTKEESGPLVADRTSSCESRNR